MCTQSPTVLLDFEHTTPAMMLKVACACRLEFCWAAEPRLYAGLVQGFCMRSTCPFVDSSADLASDRQEESKAPFPTVTVMSCRFVNGVPSYGTKTPVSNCRRREDAFC